VIGDRQAAAEITFCLNFVVIPPKRNRKVLREYGKELYKARHLIENFFAKLK
jgi:transposase